MTDMAEVVPPTVGQRLKAQREKRGTALADVAATTKISKAALLAIERDDIKLLPGGIFSRAFVRSYAQALGLDSDSTVRDFMAQFPSADEDSVEALGREGSTRRRISPGARAVLQFGLASVPLVIALVWFALPTGRHPDAALAADRVAAATSDIQAPALLRPVSTETSLHPEAVEASHQAGVLNLVLTIKAACWVSAESDGHTIVERLLNLDRPWAGEAGSRKSLFHPGARQLGDRRGAGFGAGVAAQPGERGGVALLGDPRIEQRVEAPEQDLAEIKIGQHQSPVEL